VEQVASLPHICKLLYQIMVLAQFIIHKYSRLIMTR